MTCHAPRRLPKKSFFILNLESVQLCPSPVLPHAISAQNCAEFAVKHKSKSSWTHSNPGTWKLVLILKWKTDWLVANISPTRTQLKSGTVCTVLLGTQFYAFQIQNQKRFLGKAAWGVSWFLLHPLSHNQSCLLYTSPSPRDKRQSRMPSSA